MGIDRKRLEELRAKREAGTIDRPEAEELDRLQAASEKREVKKESPLEDDEGGDPRFLPLPPD